MVPLTILTELFVDGSWVDISSDVRVSEDVVITRGRRDEGATTDPARMSLKLNNRHGKYSPRNPRSEYFGLIGRNTPIRLAVQLPNGSMSYRFTGEVSKWPQMWDLSGNDAWVSIEASGILRRLRQGLPPLKDALRRATQSASPLAYWPMTEGATAQYAEEVMGGGGPFQYRPNGSSIGEAPLQGEGSLAPWLDPVVKIPDEKMTTMAANVDYSQAAAPGWAVDFVMNGTGPICDFDMYSMGSNGVSLTWHVEITLLPSDMRVSVSRTTADDDSSSRILLGEAAPPEGFVDGPNHIRFKAEDPSGTTDWELYINGELFLSGNTGVVTIALTRISSLMQTNHPDGGGSLSVGHLTYWSLDNIPSAADAYNAVMGYSGEAAGRRIERLCAEESVSVLFTGDLEDTPAMGPQTSGRFLDLLREAETVDGGVLSEARNDASLMYRTRTSRYAAPTPAVVLDYSAGHIFDPFHPVEDDQRIANDVTTTRPNGGEARYVETEGRMSVQVPPNGVGTYDASETLNVADDGQLPNQAAWRVHLGTVDEARYPRVTVNLLANPDLAAGVSDVVEADYFRIDNPPEWLPGDPIRLIVEGYSERVNLNAWSAEIVASPASPWTVGEVPFDTLTEDFEDTTYAFPLMNTVNPMWVRDDTYAYRGSWSFRSADIGDDGLSEFVVDVPPDAYELSFAYRLSTEEGWDFFGVIGDTALFSDSGEKDWQTVTLDVHGHTVVRFQYNKDSAVSTGEDAVWVDQLTWTLVGDAADAGTAQPNRADTDGSELSAVVDATQTDVAVVTTAGLSWTTDPAEFPFDIRVGGEVMRAASIGSLVDDPFNRSVVDGWGSAPSGYTWDVVSGDATDFDVSAGIATVGAPPIDDNVALLGGFESSASEIYAELDVGTAPTSWNNWIGVVPLGTSALRSSVQIIYSTSGNHLAALLTVVDGTSTTQDTISLPSLTPGIPMAIRAMVDPSGAIYAKVWEASAGEPPNWQLSDPGIGPLSGSPGVEVKDLSAGVARYYRFEVVSPQTFTVQRSVNGVVKPHSAGTDVRLAQPSIVAL